MYFTTSYDKNQFGDLIYKNYPSGFGLKYSYDNNGYLKNIKDEDETEIIFTNNEMNGYNQYTEYELGNNKTSNQEFHFGIPTRYTTNVIQDLKLDWNYQSNNLQSRQDLIKGKTEHFAYDNVDRLTSSYGSGLQTIDVEYSDNANITSKTDVGDYSYNSSKINAVTKVTNTPDNIPSETQDISYTSFHQPKRISEGAVDMRFTYGPDEQRVKTEFQKYGYTETRYYFSGCERTVPSKGPAYWVHYISAGEDIVSIVEKKQRGEFDDVSYYYTYTDHLGSILKVTDSYANIVAEQNFDAWGRNRNPTDWTYSNIPNYPYWLYRGYTAHEMVPDFNLINMNGRMYDPLVGRMLSVDNYVPDPGYSQAYNRYSYALNNPLRYTDPDGEFVFSSILAGAAIGAALSGITTATINALSGNNPFKNIGKSMLLGATGGAIGAGISAAFAGTTFGQSAGFGILNNVASTAATSAVFEQNITVGTLVGGAVGGLIKSQLSYFTGIKGGGFVNAVAETTYKSITGAYAGGFSGVISAAINKNDLGLGMKTGLKNGAIGGFSQAALSISTMGTSYLPTKSSKYGDFGSYRPIYRKGTFITNNLFPGGGVTIGRNLVTNTKFTSKAYDEYLRAHESAHFIQQRSLGFGKMYLKTAHSYLKYGMIESYNTIGTLEWGADMHAFHKLGYFFNTDGYKIY